MSGSKGSLVDRMINEAALAVDLENEVLGEIHVAINVVLEEQLVDTSRMCASVFSKQPKSFAFLLFDKFRLACPRQQAGGLPTRTCRMGRQR